MPPSLDSQKKRVTIGFVPREQFSTTKRSFETLLERTREPFDLVIVDSGSPAKVRDYLRDVSEEHGFTLLRNEGYLTPNQARNLVLKYVQTKHVVFMDNDVLVSRGWLTALVDCAERTRAWVVGPLYCEFEPEGKRIHMFGGQVGIKRNQSGDKAYHESHDYAHVLLEEVEQTLQAKPTELIEFHTVLVQMEAFDKIGPLDEGFFSHAEHGDFCLQVAEAGGEIWVESKSLITYAPPKRLVDADRDFFLLRWSEVWCAASYRRMSEKYGVPLSSKSVKRGHRWLAAHRRYSMPWLFRVKRALGSVMGSRFEKSVVAPLEKIWNRLQYPSSRYGNLPDANVMIVDPQVNNSDHQAA